MYKENYILRDDAMKLYGVINMDIVDSRNTSNRDYIQKKILGYLEYMNNKNSDLLLTPITMTLGDEWQIVLSKPYKGYEIINTFQTFLRKDDILVYSGFGIGTISTGIYKDTRLMDGECFIKAREALNIAKNKNRFYNKHISSKKNNVYFNADDLSFNQVFPNKTAYLGEVAITTIDNQKQILTFNKIINSMIENNEILKHKVTEKQWETIQLYDKLGSYNNMVKHGESISKADISQKINGSNYFVIKNNNLNIEGLLRLYCKIKEGI